VCNRFEFGLDKVARIYRGVQLCFSPHNYQRRPAISQLKGKMEGQSSPKGTKRSRSSSSSESSSSGEEEGVKKESSASGSGEAEVEKKEEVIVNAPTVAAVVAAAVVVAEPVVEKVEEPASSGSSYSSQPQEQQPGKEGTPSTDAGDAPTVTAAAAAAPVPKRPRKKQRTAAEAPAPEAAAVVASVAAESAKPQPMEVVSNNVLPPIAAAAAVTVASTAATEAKPVKASPAKKTKAKPSATVVAVAEPAVVISAEANPPIAPTTEAATAAVVASPAEKNSDVYAEPYDTESDFTWASMDECVQQHTDIFRDLDAATRWLDSLFLKCIRYLLPPDTVAAAAPAPAAAETKLPSTALYVVKMGPGRVHELKTLRELDNLGEKLRVRYVDMSGTVDRMLSAKKKTKQSKADTAADLCELYVMEHLRYCSQYRRSMFGIRQLQCLPYIDVRGADAKEMRAVRQESGVSTLPPGIVNTFPGFAAQMAQCNKDMASCWGDYHLLVHNVKTGAGRPYNHEEDLKGHPAEAFLRHVRDLFGGTGQCEWKVTAFHRFMQRILFDGNLGRGDEPWGSVPKILLLSGNDGAWTAILEFLCTHVFGKNCTLSAKNSNELKKRKVKNLPDAILLLTIGPVEEDDITVRQALVQPFTPATTAKQVPWLLSLRHPLDADHHYQTPTVAKRRAQGHIDACRVGNMAVVGGVSGTASYSDGDHLLLHSRQQTAPRGPALGGGLVLDQGMADEYVIYLGFTKFPAMTAPK